VASLRENAFELHAELHALMRENADESDDLAEAAVCIQSVANQLGRAEAVMAPHHALLASTGVRR
jgi:hypothetical protein